MPKFDDTIRQAVMRACEAMGGECALAAAVGCSQTQISRYRSGGGRIHSPGELGQVVSAHRAVSAGGFSAGYRAAKAEKSQ